MRGAVTTPLKAAGNAPRTAASADLDPAEQLDDREQDDGAD